MTFTYHGARLDYFDHSYNDTIRNERAVEVAVAMHWRQGRRADGLEVGNVLGHYGIRGHRVVDLHEEEPGVENVDVLAVTGSYPWIVALSTVEHVGRDEDPRDDARAIDAVLHLVSLLEPGGSLLVTVPGGYNPTLDAALTTIGAARQITYRRAGDGWQATDEPVFLPYGASTPWAESVWIGEW